MEVKGNIPFFFLLVDMLGNLKPDIVENSISLFLVIPLTFLTFFVFICLFTHIYFELESHCVDQIDLKLTEISLLQFLKCWD